MIIFSTQHSMRHINYYAITMWCDGQYDIWQRDVTHNNVIQHSIFTMTDGTDAMINSATTLHSCVWRLCVVLHFCALRHIVVCHIKCRVILSCVILYVTSSIAVKSRHTTFKLALKRFCNANILQHVNGQSKVLKNTLEEAKHLLFTN